MRPLTHLGVFCGLLAIVIAPRLAWPHFFDHDRKAVSARATLIRAKQIEADWKRATYNSFETPGDADAFMARVDWSKLELNELQRAKLKSRLLELLRYLQHPQFDDYYLLKTEGLHYHFAPNVGVSNLLARAFRQAHVAATADPKECSKMLWSMVHDQKGKQVLPKITAVALDRLAVSISYTNSGRVLLGGPVKNGFTIGVEAFNPGFQYDRAADSSHEPLLFEFSFLARTSHSDDVGPMYFSLMWIEPDQNWALNRLVLDKWLGSQTLF